MKIETQEQVLALIEKYYALQGKPCPEILKSEMIHLDQYSVTVRFVPSQTADAVTIKIVGDGDPQLLQ